MTAAIEKIGEHPLTPDLLLAMCRANIEDIESVVISVIADGEQKTFWTPMKNADLAFHIYGIQTDLNDRLSDDR